MPDNDAVVSTNLCCTCRYAMVVRGGGPSQELIFCEYAANHYQMPWPVVECSGYMDKRMIGRGEMEDMAYVILPDRSICSPIRSGKDAEE